MLWAWRTLLWSQEIQLTQAAQQNNVLEALLRQTIRHDLSASPDIGRIWGGLYERIVGPRAGDISAFSAERHYASGGVEAEEVGLLCTT